MIASNPVQEDQLFQWVKDLGLRVSHETIRNVFEKQKYSSRGVRKTPAISAKFIKVTTIMSLLSEYWDEVIFENETKIMQNYHLRP